MAQSFKSDRIKFHKMAEQIQFLENAKKSLGLDTNEFASFLNIHSRTLRDWKNGVRSMSYESAISISSKTGVILPADVIIIKWNDHLKKIAPTGGRSSYTQSGFGRNPAKREKAWREWWETKGRFQGRDILLPRKISFPRKSEKLAEFVGIMMGDGGISKYHISITLNSKTDKEYSIFVKDLVKELFNVDPGINKRKGFLALDIVVNRIKLVSFCESIGLKIGNKLKQGLDIPPWILKNKKYQTACIRGLVDTDGSFFKHSYVVKGKKYCYGKIGFSSRSPELINSVHRILTNFCINSKINYNGYEVKIESIEGVHRYMSIVGTNNPKHKAKNIDK